MIEELTYNAPTQVIDYNNIFLLSDVHFGVRANSLEWLENQLSYFRNFYIPFLKKHVKPNDILIILGDWFDNRQLLDIYVMNSAMQVLEEISTILPVYHMVGNHDLYKKYDTDVNSMTPFKHNITIFEKPTIISNNKSTILVVPWIGIKEEEEKWIENNPTDYVFLHTDMSGFKYDNGRDITKGLDVSRIKAKKVFSGHIHKRQELKNKFYIGSPYHTKRSDIGNPKGVYIFNPNQNCFDFYVNTFSPNFQRVLLESILDMTIEEVSSIFENNYTDIVIPAKFIHKFNLTKFMDLLKDCKYKKIEAISEIKNEEDIAEILDDIDIRDIPTLISNVIEELKVDNDKVTNLKILNKKYYEKASNNMEELIIK